MSEPKRLYYYTGPEFALDIVARRQLKLSFPNEVNDLFEMTPFNFNGDKQMRKAWRETIEDFSQKFGFVSFSSDWTHPTMWGHYANNHTGVCLGFDVAGDVLPIEYEKKFILFDPKALKDPPLLKKLVLRAQRTKSEHWKYENEWRGYIQLSDEQKELRVRIHNQYMTVAASAMADRKTLGQRS